MSKGYVKENGKWRLTENQAPKTQPLTLEELDARLKRVESIVIGPQK